MRLCGARVQKDRRNVSFVDHKLSIVPWESPLLSKITVSFDLVCVSCCSRLTFWSARHKKVLFL